MLLYYISLFYFIIFWILFTCELWMPYSGLEMQWMLPTIMFIIGSSIHSGLFNYLMLNGILSIRLMIGMLFGNSMFYIMSVFGKIGYFPFSLLLSSLWYCSSYVWLMFDVINKWAYFGSFLVIFHYSIFQPVFSFSYYFILFNFLILIFFIKLMVPIKQMILMSSLMTYLFIMFLILVNEYLFSFSFLCFYSILMLVMMILLFSLGNFFINEKTPFTGSIDLISINLFLCLLTDYINIKVYMILVFLLLILFRLIVFSFFPMTMFLNKFFSMSFLINTSVSMSFNPTFFPQSLYQVCFSSSIIMFVMSSSLTNECY